MNTLTTLFLADAPVLCAIAALALSLLLSLVELGRVTHRS